MNNEELWKAVLGEMEVSLSKANFITWFKGTSVISNEKGVVVVTVPNGFVKEWLENKFNKQIFQFLRNLDQEIKEVRYIIGLPKTSLATDRKELVRLATDHQIEEKQDFDIDKNTNLNKKYTFESFIVGSNNELANAAAVAVCKNPGKTYNPLFIYGGVGLGKTHLLQAIGNKVMLDNFKLKLVYLPSERLVVDIVESIKNKTIEELKNSYSKLDMLIVDDIQFIAGKEKTQDIFFSVFNELYGKNRQIIISSDRPPKAIPALEERLRSRFEGGMIADIGMPDFETRLAILKLKTKEKNFEIDEETLSYIATNIQKNIRELEGALTRIIAVSQIYNRIPDLKEVKKFLNTYLSAPFRKTTPQFIIKNVVDFYGINLNDLIKRGRKKEIVRPRQIVMYLLREELKLSFPEIGQKLGGRDHSTVIHACEKIKKEEENDETTKQELVLIRERVYQFFDK